MISRIDQDGRWDEYIAWIQPRAVREECFYVIGP